MADKVVEEKRLCGDRLEYKNYLKQQFPEYVDNLVKLVRIPSVLRKDSSGRPFGSPIDRALREMLSICDALGFKTYYDPEGYYGYAEIGSGSEIIGILGHLDVVPAGDLKEWNYHPFDPSIENGKMYGRGTQDDKGPTLAAVYAVKALVESGVTFNKRVRFIFGTDEETLWRGIKRYEALEEMPTCGFSPDSKFPLIYAEKGLLQVKLTGRNDLGFEMELGDAFNSVPSEAAYDGPERQSVMHALDSCGFDYSKATDAIVVHGKSVHAQVAETGVNAIARLCMAMYEANLTNAGIDFVATMIGEDPFGRKIFGRLFDDVSGDLKLNLGKLKMSDDKVTLSLDLRIPVSVSKAHVEDRLKKVAKSYNLQYEEHDYLRSIHVKRDSKLIKTLMNAYSKVTGDEVSVPMTAGGATYARAMDNCVAFGAVLPGRAKTEHQPNEHIVLEDMFIAMQIYAESVKGLLESEI